jgi:hypothetical protein
MNIQTSPVSKVTATHIKPGYEAFEVFYSPTLKKELVEYQYRHTDGELFACVRATLDDCRKARDRWQAAKALKEAGL